MHVICLPLCRSLPNTIGTSQESFTGVPWLFLQTYDSVQRSLMDDLKPLHSSKLYQGKWAKSFHICSSNEIIRLKIPFCSGSKYSVRFFMKTPSFSAAGMAFINNQCMAQSAALYHGVCLALVAPSFKGGTSDMTEGSFWGGQRCGIHHRYLWHIQQHPCGCISDVCVSFTERGQQSLKCSPRELASPGSLPWECGCSSVYPELEI